MMKTINTLKYLVAGCFSLALCSQTTHAAQLVEQEPMTLALSKPTFVLPQFTGPYSDREASIAPEEYEQAERLKAKLEGNDIQAVVEELEEYWEIELSPAMLALKAQVYFAIEDFERAEATYLAVLARKPQLVRAHADLGQLYLVKKDYKKARDYFAKAVSLGANDAMIYGQLAYLNLTLHGPYSAISAYQQALMIEPNQAQWLQGLFVALTQAKMYQAAKALLEEQIATKQDNPELWVNLAAIYLEQNETRDALSALEMAILNGDKNENTLKTAAQLHLQAESFDRAVELIKYHIEGGKLPIKTLNAYLTWLDQAQMWQQANEVLSSFSSQLKQFTDQEQSVYYTHSALIKSKQKQTKQAESHFSLAVSKDPNNGQALLEYAEFARANKNYIKAQSLYIRAEAFNQWHKQASLGKAQLYIDTQDYPAALSILNQVMLRYPEVSGLDEQIELIKNIIKTQYQNQA
ncbi:tetratricopeptide repeat protein [Catenovulum sp. SM1970]|uniref:tetratricopeptide repeat protein n=1 Tax=Marinifaba aquimaris TaxID=2741323 RepID=UPI001572651D|nr:tetratricopeptide repeat protein [Marinifaba aquimaris]NTS76676.1 tetratricopeptide repeat protein [Marinifaba aquimaris]